MSQVYFFTSRRTIGSTACRGKEQASSDRMSFIDTSLPELPLFVQLDINSTSPLRSWESTREALCRDCDEVSLRRACQFCNEYHRKKDRPNHG